MQHDVGKKEKRREDIFTILQGRNGSLLDSKNRKLRTSSSGSGTSSHTNGGLQYNQLLQRKLIRSPTMNKKKVRSHNISFVTSPLS